MSVDRGLVWRILGAPTDQEGSVNDPRTRVEHGVTWNEKWIYLDADGRWCSGTATTWLAPSASRTTEAPRRSRSPAFRKADP